MLRVVYQRDFRHIPRSADIKKYVQFAKAEIIMQKTATAIRKNRRMLRARFDDAEGSMLNIYNDEEDSLR